MEGGFVVEALLANATPGNSVAIALLSSAAATALGAMAGIAAKRAIFPTAADLGRLETVRDIDPALRRTLSRL